MPTPRRISSVSATRWALAFACGALACDGRLSVPPEVAENSDVLLVEDRAFAPGAFGASEEFRLGGRQVSKVERRGFGLGLGKGGSSAHGFSGGYSFRFDGQRGPLVGRCDTADSATGTELSSVVSIEFTQASLVCECGGAATLRLAGTESEEYSGRLEVAGRRYEISTTYEALWPAGYTVSGKKPVAVLDNMNPGQRVWISRAWETEHRDELSCLFASLLLYKPPQ